MIRKAMRADAEAVARLAAQMWVSHTADELTEDFRLLMDNEEAAVFLCVDDAQVIGFAQCQLRHDYVEGTESSPVGYLEGIFVTEGYRNRGYAKELLAACEQWAREQGCKEFASDCELANVGSFRFHMAMGFEEANRVICFKKRI